jgi:hypothetical protein
MSLNGRRNREKVWKIHQAMGALKEKDLGMHAMKSRIYLLIIFKLRVNIFPLFGAK